MREQARRRLTSRFTTKRSSSTLMVLVCGLCLLASTALLAPGVANAEGEAALDVLFVLDNSGSMKENDPEFLARAAVEDFATALAANPDIEGRIGIVLFDGEARLIRPLSSIKADGDRPHPLDALDLLVFSGQRTNSPAGIERALYEFRQNGREDAKRAIVLLTDGMIDTGDAREDLEAARWLREDLASESRASNIRIFGVAFTEAADYQLMQAVAQRTNARYYRAFAARDLTDVVDDVLDSIITSDRDRDELVAGTDEDEIGPADVSAARVEEGSGSGLRLLGLLPVAAVFVAGALYWRSRRRVPVSDASSIPESHASEPARAQILDVGGHLGPAGASIELARGRTAIGRDAHNEVVLDADSISSEHALIEYRDGRYWIEDRRSTNGTSVGDQLLVPGHPVQLKGGDRIRFADVDLMFVLAGYVPGGNTVFLNPTTTPPPEPDLEEALEAAVAARVQHREDAVEEAAEEADKAADVVVESDSQLSLLQPVEPEADSPAEASSPSDVPSAESPPTLDPALAEDRAIRNVLDDHLRRVAALSGAFASFIDRAFGEEIRGAIAVSARDLTSEARETDLIVRKEYTMDRIRFVICGVPGEVDRARELMAEAFGGFTRMLSEELHADSFRGEQCEILAVLTFGFETTPWVSLSIVPDDGQDPRIDLLSYEFLTEEELHEIDLDEHTDLSQSGLG